MSTVGTCCWLTSCESVIPPGSSRAARSFGERFNEEAFKRKVASTSRGTREQLGEPPSEWGVSQVVSLLGHVQVFATSKTLRDFVIRATFDENPGREGFWKMYRDVLTG